MGLIFLQFALIWCGFVAVLFLGLWWVAGQIAEGMSPVFKYVLYSPVLGLAIFGPLQAVSPWKLALPFDPTSIFAVSALAWIAVFAGIVAEKASSLKGWVLGIIVGACALPAGVVVLMLLLQQKEHDLHGRISPTLTYEVTSGTTWFEGTTYTYVIYRNPSFASWLRRKAAEATVPCTPVNLRLDPWRFQAGTDDRTVVISCDGFGRDVYSTEIRLR
jgi:hypothetical protein